MLQKSELVDELHEATKITIAKLDAIWDEMGLDCETRKSKGQLFSNHVKDLYIEMLTEVEESKNDLSKKIDCLLQELHGLGQDLRLDISIPDENTALYRAKEQLESKLRDYRVIYEERKTKIKKLQSEEKSLCKALGRKLKDLSTSPLPSDEELQEFRIYLEEMSDRKFQLEEEFLKKKSSIIHIMAELGIHPSLDFEKQVVLGDDNIFQVSEENMQLLQALHDSLVQQLEENCIKISELREQISYLWEVLEESPDVRSNFLHNFPGNSVDTLKALKMEVVRCQEKKKENIRLYVDKVRMELIGWWDKCRFSPEQRAHFEFFDSDCYTEDLLSFHELERDKIKKQYENNKIIYELVTKREQLWNKMVELEQRANQPDRFKNRGGQLLREEKERKSIASELPKIENELLELIAQYESKTGNPFLVSGSRMADVIELAWEEHKENKHITLSARKHARDLTKITPCKPRIGTPRLQTLTPGLTMTTSKRRLIATPVFSTSKRSRLNDDKILKSAPPKLQVNGCPIRRVSTERRKRMERVRRSKSRFNKDDTIASTISDYDGFERGIETKPTCRSSLFPDRVLRNKTAQLSVASNLPSTPRRALVPLSNTPQRTPSRLNMRSKSPMGSTTRLATAPGTLPIII